MKNSKRPHQKTRVQKHKKRQKNHKHLSNRENIKSVKIGNQEINLVMPQMSTTTLESVSFTLILTENGQFEPKNAISSKIFDPK